MTAARTSPDGLRILDEQECYARIVDRYVGRLGYVQDGRPVIVPVNYRVDGDGAIVVLTTEGSKLEAARNGDVLCLQVDEVDELYRSGWSVLVTGRASVVDAPGGVAEAHGLQLRTWARQVPRTELILIAPERIEGRDLH